MAVGDIDNDGWDEIYVCQPGGLPNRLYKNRDDGTCADITEGGVGMLDDTTCALFADFRNSGPQDLVVLGASGRCCLSTRAMALRSTPDAFHFRTPRRARLREWRRRITIATAGWICTSAATSTSRAKTSTVTRFPIMTRAMGRPIICFATSFPNPADIFWMLPKKRGSITTTTATVLRRPGATYDGDGWPDLYVANDFGKSNLYRNRNGKFRDEAAEAGVENTGPGMSAAWFDYDGDGRPDLYVSNMWTRGRPARVNDPAFVPGRELKAAYHGHTKGNSLYRNLGDGTFRRNGRPARRRHGAMGLERGRAGLRQRRHARNLRHYRDADECFGEGREQFLLAAGGG